MPPEYHGTATRPADGIELVDEYDAGRLLASLMKKVTDAGGTDAHEHLDEFGLADVEKRHARFPGDGTGEQGLAGTGRTEEQYALGHVAAEPLDPLGVLEEFYTLLQLLLGLVDPDHVVERNLRQRIGVNVDAIVADIEETAGAPHATAHPSPEEEMSAKGTIHVNTSAIQGDARWTSYRMPCAANRLASRMLCSGTVAN